MRAVKFSILFLLLILTVSLPAFSRDRVAVLDFEAKDVELSDALAVSDLFRSDLVATNLFTVLERSNMETILSEHELQLSGVTDSASASEIGELLSVDYLFLGNLSKFGSKYILIIDRINIETGEIEQSVKKTAVNIDSFIPISTEIAFEMSGSEGKKPETTGGILPYDSVTLTQLIADLNVFELDALKIDTKRMQATDVPLRWDFYKDNKREDSLAMAGLNLVSFGIAGSFIQGFDAYGWTCVGTTGAFAAAMLLSGDTSPVRTITGLLFGASWLVSLGVPFFYELDYNKNLKDKLLIF